MMSDTKKDASGAESHPSGAANSAKDKRSQEEIVAQFNKLRQEQRALVTKVSEIQMDLNEHKLVAKTLQDCDGDRKCFRLIGGVLVERTVKEILPALESNRDKLSKLVETLEKQLQAKGEEINDFISLHNIQIRGADSTKPATATNTGDGAKKEGVPGSPAQSGSTGILVQSSKHE